MRFAGEEWAIIIGRQRLGAREKTMLNFLFIDKARAVFREENISFGVA